MLKLILVEDEFAIRESIRKNVKWDMLGYTFAGDASDGEMAYALIKEKKPDVIIVDIKMPFMDGLELSRLIRKEMPEVKIIILTGYNDFDTIHQALHIGVCEYLLKPVTMDKLADSITRIRLMVESEREQQKYRFRYKQEMEELRDVKLQRFFENCLLGSKKVYELLEDATQFGISLGAQNYSIVRFQLFKDDETEAYSDEIVDMYARIEDRLKQQPRFLIFKQGLQGWVIVVKGDEEQCAADSARAISKELEKMLAASSNIQYIIAVGNQVDRLQDIAKAYNAASRAYAHRYALGHNTTIFSESLVEKPYQAEEIKLQNLDVKKIDRVLVDRFLRIAAKGTAETFLDDLFRDIGEHYLQSLLLRQYIVMDIHFAVSDFLDRIGVGRAALLAEFGDLDRVSVDLSNVAGTKRFLSSLLEYTMTLRDSASSKRYDDLIHQAKAFIDASYMDENISLNIVAKEVNLSPAHFSSIFSQETGRTFTEYLTAIRMDKAKELLQCSAKKSSDIAYEVGYRDPHYFSYLFKKLNGCSPREFRGERKEVV